jgi:hypothetical protein
MAIKIIKDGKIEKPIYRSECKECGCVFEYNREDAEIEYAMSGFAYYLYLPCPYCGRTVFEYGEPINKRDDTTL